MIARLLFRATAHGLLALAILAAAAVGMLCAWVNA